jgi:trk system potassium uptake protein TrkH
MNTAIIYRLLSMVLVALAAAFAVCGGAGLLSGETISDRAPRAFGLSILISLFLAAFAHWLAQQGTAKLFRREALCTIGLSWILATVVGAIPYFLIVKDCAIADAIFESCSGLTTTGATAFPDFHEFPKSLLYWRSLSQWIGGLGVVVFFIAWCGRKNSL